MHYTMVFYILVFLLHFKKGLLGTFLTQQSRQVRVTLLGRRLVGVSSSGSLQVLDNVRVALEAKGGEVTSRTQSVHEHDISDGQLASSQVIILGQLLLQRAQASVELVLSVLVEKRARIVA